eukprot:COSAG01_NODE_12279_length_1767_cov_4.000600_1_plen_171_part_00
MCPDCTHTRTKDFLGPHRADKSFLETNSHSPRFSVRMASGAGATQPAPLQLQYRISRTVLSINAYYYVLVGRRGIQQQHRSSRPEHWPPAIAAACAAQNRRQLCEGGAGRRRRRREAAASAPSTRSLEGRTGLGLQALRGPDPLLPHVGRGGTWPLTRQRAVFARQAVQP